MIDAYRGARLLIPLLAEKGVAGSGRERPDRRQDPGAVDREGRGPDGRSVLPVFTSVTTMVRRRYQVFKEQTWTALTSLRQLYHYHFVNAEGPIEEVQANILAELRYQSSLSSIRARSSGCGPCPSPKKSSCTAVRHW